MKVQISGKQIFMIMYSYILANDLIRGIYAFSLKNNLWIPELLGIIGSIIIFSGYLLIYKNNNYGNFTESIENISGKFISRFLFILYPVYFVLISIFTIRDIIELVRIFLIENMPTAVLCFCMLVTFFYVITKGVEVMARLFTLFFAIFVGLYISMAFANILINKPNLEFLFPILEEGFKPVIMPAIKMSYAIPFGELFAVLILFQFVKDKKKKQKAALAGIIFGGGALLFITLLSITIFGPGAMTFGLNPSLELAALIDIKNFIQRLDLVLICILGFHTFVKVSIMIFCGQLLLNQAFKVQQKQWVSLFFMCLVIFIVVTFFTKNYFLITLFRERYIIPYVSMVFEVIIPAFLILVSFFRKPKVQKNEFNI